MFSYILHLRYDTSENQEIIFDYFYLRGNFYFYYYIFFKKKKP
jgi:hypothetical protein